MPSISQYNGKKYKNEKVAIALQDGITDNIGEKISLMILSSKLGSCDHCGDIDQLEPKQLVYWHNGSWICAVCTIISLNEDLGDDYTVDIYKKNEKGTYENIV